MALPQMKNGEPGKMIERVVGGVVKHVSHQTNTFAIFSNRWPVNTQGRSLAELEREVAVTMGLPSYKIEIPIKPRDPRIRNTYEEARFAIKLTNFVRSDTRPKTLLVVANHLHMRRARATFQKLLSQREDRRLGWQ